MILSAAEKKNRAIRKRRKIAIIAIAVFVAVLSVALVFILDYVKTSTFVDPADGTEYFIRYREKAYALYDTDKKTKLPTDEKYKYYVTHAGTLVNVDAVTGEIKNTIYVDLGSLVAKTAATSISLPSTADSRVTAWGQTPTRSGSISNITAQKRV